jgi:hypothetical protein
VILYTLLQGRLPFDGRTAQEIMNRASTQAPDMEGIHSAVADFLKWYLLFILMCFWLASIELFPCMHPAL